MPIPSQGVVRIYPSVVSIINGTWSISGNGTGSASPLALQSDLQAYYDARLDDPTNAPRIQYATEYPPAGGQWVPNIGDFELSFSSDTTRILFDTLGTPTEIDFLSADFPVGTVFDQLLVYFNGAFNSVAARDRRVTELKMQYFGSYYNTTQGSPLPSGSFNGTTVSTPTTAIIPAFNRWSPIQTFKPFGFKTTVSSVSSAVITVPTVRNDLCYFECLYNNLYFNISLVIPNALPGNIAEINGDRLDNFISFEIYWDVREGEDENPNVPGMAGGIPLNENYILTRTNTNLRFIMPDYEYQGMLAPYGGKRLMLVGIPDAGTFFTGYQPLANFNIELVDGSGLYTLTRGQKYDTYYDRSVTPPVTVDLKIPDPFVKTPFINS